MTWYALDNIEEALQDTKDKLLPFELVTWAKLAVIVFLTGSAAGGPSYVNPGNFGGGDFSEPNFDEGVESDFSSSLEGLNVDMHQMNNFEAPENLAGFDAAYAVLFAVGVALFGLLLLLTYITSVFQFVMYKSMIDDVKIGYAKNFLSEGLQYFIFRWITLVATVLVVGLGFGLGTALGLSFNIYGILGGIGIGAVVLAGILVIGVIRWIAFNLALPEMVRNGSGLSTALEKSISEARDQFAEVGVFWLMKLVIGLGLGIATMTIIFPAVILLLIPFGIIGYLLMLLTPAFLVPVILLYFLAVLVLGLAVSVPVKVYTYSYILEMHGDLLQ